MQEREVGLRLKGENGIMKKKFHALSKDIKGQEDEIKELNNQKSQLYVQISNLEKEIVSLKKEVTERDETIGVLYAQIMRTSEFITILLNMCFCALSTISVQFVTMVSMSTCG